MYDIIVIGAGINGLSTAYHLALRGVKRLAVVEQFKHGHPSGSSHSFSRITRSTYSVPKYVELVQVAHDEEWPRLEKEAGERLLHPCPGCFFGPGLDPYQRSLEAVPEVLPRIEILDVGPARKVFPHFNFSDSTRVIWDKTCALVAAQASMLALRAALLRRGVEILEERAVTSLEFGGRVRLNTDNGPLEAEQVVVAAGAWAGRLLPELRPKLRPAHQDVGYFRFSGAPGVAVEEFPVWVYAGAQGLAGDDTFYGLPEFGREGVKLARHRTGLHSDDPDRTLSAEMPAEVEKDLMDFARAQFAYPARACGYEACMYTNTAHEEFVLDHYPPDRRVVIASACSGHGFKFGPLTGRIVAGLVLDGKSDVPAFERYRQDFGLASIPDWE